MDPSFRSLLATLRREYFKSLQPRFQLSRGTNDVRNGGLARSKVKRRTLRDQIVGS
jgi:hypothetical protein